MFRNFFTFKLTFVIMLCFNEIHDLHWWKGTISIYLYYYDTVRMIGALYLLFVYWSEKVRVSTFLIVGEDYYYSQQHHMFLHWLLEVFGTHVWRCVWGQICSRPSSCWSWEWCWRRPLRTGSWRSPQSCPRLCPDTSGYPGATYRHRSACGGFPKYVGW